MPELLHENECFSCWLRALDADLPLIQSVLTNAFLIGAATGIGAMGAQMGITPEQVIELAGGNLVRIRLTEQAMADIKHMVRSDLAAPPSPDVAQAMGHQHGGQA